MATVVVVHGRNKGEWYTIGERPLIFGRDDELLAEILDPTVSRRHLEVRHEPRDDRYLAIDLNSRNGVRCNGKRIRQPQVLQNEDLLQIGKTFLVFTTEEFADAKHADAYVDKCQEKYREYFEKVLKKAEQEEQRDEQMQATHVFSLGTIFGKRFFGGS